MKAIYIPQRYANVHQFFNDADIRMSPAKRSFWRLTDIVPGEFRACPGSRGLLMATNGILAFTMNEKNKAFLGHLENFIADEVVVESSEKQTASLKTDRKAKRRAVLDELRELLA